MTYTLVINEDALVEMSQARLYHELKRVGLGDELLEEIDDCIESICDNPFKHGVLIENEIFRQALVDKFPYLVIFSVEGKNVLINSVVHEKQSKRA